MNNFLNSSLYELMILYFLDELLHFITSQGCHTILFKLHFVNWVIVVCKFWCKYLLEKLL